MLSLFFMNGNIFRQLKLEIVLAIPASNEWKIETNTSAAQGLMLIKGLSHHNFTEFKPCDRKVVISA